jgi:hypothetical protein
VAILENISLFNKNLEAAKMIPTILSRPRIFLGNIYKSCMEKEGFNM